MVRRKIMKPLSVSETSTVIQARIEGLTSPQVPAVNRLRGRGVPDELIYAAMVALDSGTLQEKQKAFETAESAIIDWAIVDRGIPSEDAVNFLNSTSTARW
jgi:hypothetical protein